MKITHTLPRPLWVAARPALAALLLLPLGCEMPEIEIEDVGSTPVAEPAAEDANVQAETAGPAEPVEPREFTATDPKRGKKSRAVGGYAGAVFGARFSAEHRMIINQYKQALSLYNATNGFYPKTHDEFMEKIIQANQIKLPELDEGEEYLYDPSDHELKVQPKTE